MKSLTYYQLESLICLHFPMVARGNNMGVWWSS